MSKRIIIIGGMGPQASLELHRRIIRRAIELGAANGGEFPEITHLSLPIDDFISDDTKMRQASDVITDALEYFYFWRCKGSVGLQYGSFAYARA